MISRLPRFVLLLCVLLHLGACAGRPQSTLGGPPASQDPGHVDTPPPPPASDRAKVVVQAAKSRIGARYQWGGTGSNGYDCSGLVLSVYAEVGMRLPRTTREQAKMGSAVERSKIRPGDLIFFGDGPKSITHVGIASGKGRYVHSSQSRGVVEDPFDSSYFRSRFVGARRVL